MTKNIKFEGFPYPILKDAKGYYRIQGGVRQIRSDLLILLLTNPGERVMLPLFGTDLRSLIFEPNDTLLVASARSRIINAINAWEPRITVQQVTVTNTASKSDLSPADPGTEAENILMINITFFDPENIQEVQSLDLQVPLGT